MRKFLLLLILFSIAYSTVFASTDKYSEVYLKSKKHFSIITPLAETIASGVIKSIIKSEVKGRYKVKCSGYNISSMKEGILKSLEIKGKNVVIETVKIPILNIKTVTDYNRIDYSQNPPIIISDLILDYYTEIDDAALKSIVNSEKYKKQIEKVNYILSPLVILDDVDMSIINNSIKLDITYNFPFKKRKSSQKFSIITGLKVFNNKIKLFSDDFDKKYAEYQFAKIINLLDPFNFNADFLENKKCNIKVEHVNIIDNIIRINGRIYIEADNLSDKMKGL